MNGQSNKDGMALHAMPAVETTRASAPGRSARRAFTFHLVEMLIAMVAGMVLLGGAIEGVLALAGASLSNASASLSAAVMAFNMTAPMVWWMRYRGHPTRHNAEMAASMLVPTAVVIAFYWGGAIASSTVMMAQHVVMIPAMVGVMLWRYDHYSH